MMTRLVGSDEVRFRLESSRYPAERISDECLREPCVIGIDEAGRGPVLGPMVYASFISPVSRLPWLKDNGAHDSKQLSEEARQGFFNVLLKSAPAFGWKAKALHPEYISNCMLQKDKYNLNDLSYDTVFSIIASLLAVGITITEAYVDTLGKPEKYQARLTSRFPSIRFTVRSKADALFPIVGAASIVAKVLRDDILHSTMGVHASGYPGDEATVTWLREHLDPVFGFPPIVRFSWGTSRELVERHCLPVKWVDDETGSKGGAGTDHQRSGSKGPSKRSKGSGCCLIAPPNLYVPFGLTSDARRSW